MLEALVQGTRDPKVLAELARGRMRTKLPALRQALVGHFRPHHAFLAIQILAHLDHLEGAVATLSERIAAILVPFAEAAQRLVLGITESAGKHISGKTRKGNIWLLAALVEAALGATRTRNSAFAARYRRVLRHRGHKKAIVAVAHSLLVTAYHVLADYYDCRLTRRALQTLEQQGYRVTLERAK